MSHLVRPSTPPGDDLDGHLRAFYRAEMPDPWPSLEAPASRAPLPARPAPRRTGFWGSRLALAASLALLLGGSLFLSGVVPTGKPAGPTSIPIVGPPTAKHEKILEERQIVVDPEQGAFDKLILTPDHGAPIK